MSSKLGPQVPETVRLLLEDEPDRQIGVTILVITVGADGWPHVAMVSVGELLATTQQRLALALWPTSTCAANLARTGQATLALVAGGRAFSLECTVDVECRLETDGHPPTRGFGLRVTEAAEDAAPYADLVAGVSYRLHDPASTLPRWSATRAALRSAFGGA